ncbi:MAG: response regulator [Chloroflexales bacterium]
MTTLLGEGLLTIGLAGATLLLGVLLALSIWRAHREQAALWAIIADLREHEVALRRQIDEARAQVAAQRSPQDSRAAAVPLRLGGEGQPPAPSNRAASADSTDRHAAEASAPGLAILVAEDNPVNRAMALRQIERLGYAADSVINGREAVDAVRRRRYDLILMDLQMPELDGDLASRAIRELGDAVHQPVIVAVTANAMDGDRERCLAAGMDDYLTKPVLIADLRQAIGRVVPPAGQAAPAPPAPPQRPSADAPCTTELISESNIVAALDTLSDDYAEALKMMLELYRDEISMQIEGLEGAVRRHDRNEIRQAAHKLLGGCSQLGAAGMARRCAALEQSAATAPLTDLARQITDIRSCYPATMRAVLERFSRADGVGAPPPPPEL